MPDTPPTNPAIAPSVQRSFLVSRAGKSTFEPVSMVQGSVAWVYPDASQGGSMGPIHGVRLHGEDQVIPMRSLVDGIKERDDVWVHHIGHASVIAGRVGGATGVAVGGTDGEAINPVSDEDLPTVSITNFMNDANGNPYFEWAPYGPRFQDNFNRIDSFLLGTSSLAGVPWTDSAATAAPRYAGSWSHSSVGISSNQAYSTKSNSAPFNNIDVALFDIFYPTDVDVSVKLGVRASTTGTNAGLVFRWVDSNNFWWLFFDNTTDGGHPQLFKVVGGVYTQVAAFTSIVNAAGDSLRVVDEEGFIIRVYYNNVLIGTYNDSTLGFSGATRYGIIFMMQGTYDASWRLDDFVIYPTPAYPWKTGLNSEIQISTDYALEGLHSLKWTRTQDSSAGLSGLECGHTSGVWVPTPGYPPIGLFSVNGVPVGSTFTVECWALAGTHSAEFHLGIVWFDASGNFAGGSSQFVGTFDNTSGWTRIWFTAFNPSAAVYGQVYLTSTETTVGAVHYLDSFQIYLELKEPLPWDDSAEYRGPGTPNPSHSEVVDLNTTAFGEGPVYGVFDTTTTTDPYPGDAHFTLLEEGIYSILLLIYTDPPSRNPLNSAAVGIQLQSYGDHDNFDPFLQGHWYGLFATSRLDRYYDTVRANEKDVFGDLADAYYQGWISPVLPCKAGAELRMFNLNINMDYDPTVWIEMLICRIGSLGSWAS